MSELPSQLEAGLARHEAKPALPVPPNPPAPPCWYIPNPAAATDWCVVHNRPATHIRMPDEHKCCNPKLGGILLPCWLGSEK